MNTDPFEVLKESLALKAEALKLEFRSFVNESERETVLERLASDAEAFGYRLGREGMDLPTFLTTDPAVAGPAECGYEQGFESFMRLRYEAEHCSQQAWDALSCEEQTYYMEQFHSLCAQGIGEDCRFYRLLMDHYLHNLIGEARAKCRTGELVTTTEVRIDRNRAAIER
jgi:hypothetical protein